MHVASGAGIGVVSFCGSGMQQWGFGVVGQRLTRRLRVLLFSAILRQVQPAVQSRQACELPALRGSNRVWLISAPACMFTAV